ncbi:hypothetical protein VCRA2119O48_200094 [Vibrio crassostreae]|nr:hypothetical protein VCRA2119O48_200094 [Vibrio crassostreae]CAK3218233.1 hypothetical protein VCRA213O314_190010 [Vibrio crassostreae]CAK3841411.1 hypothetical protein VCRA212O16_210095 [Vibrio crassostreae]
MSCWLESSLLLHECQSTLLRLNKIVIFGKKEFEPSYKGDKQVCMKAIITTSKSHKP